MPYPYRPPIGGWGPKAAGFTDPSSLPGLLWWAEMPPKRLVESGGEVESWGETGYSCTFDASANKPDLLTSPHRIDFDGSEMLISSATVPITSFTLFFVQYLNGIGRTVMEQSVNSVDNDGFFLYSGGGHISVRKGGTRMGRNITAGIPIDTTFRVWRYEYDGTEAGTKIWLDGVEQGMTTVIGGDPGTAEVNDTVHFFARNGPSSGMVGQAKASVGYSPILSESDAALLDDPSTGYLTELK